MWRTATLGTNTRNIKCEKYVRKFWDLESMILLEKTFLDYLLLVELLVVMVFKS